MASRLSRSLLQTTKGRLYTAQAAAQADSQPTYIPPEAPKVSTVKNVRVASVETNSPLSKIGIAVRAGPRDERHTHLGVTHFLRNTAMLTNSNSSQFRITKEMHQTGGNLSVSSAREYMLYSCETTRQFTETGMKFLVDMVTKPSLRPWEFPSATERMYFDLAVLNDQPNVRVIELLHEAAFRDTLGNSLYCPETNIPHMNISQLTEFMNLHYSAENIALVGIGVDHKYLKEVAEEMVPCGGQLIEEGDEHWERKPAKYHGGERRQLAAAPTTYAAVATEGPSLASKDLLVAGVLQLIMGTGPYMKYSEGVTGSRLAKAIAKEVKEPFSISGLNANYTDSGLFGFVAAAKTDTMEKVLRAAFHEFAAVTKAGVTDQEVAKAKNQLKSSIVMMQESIEGQFFNLAEQVMTSDQLQSAEDICKAIDSITKDQVVTVAKKLVAGKASMGAVGNVGALPYLDELYN